MIVIRLDHGAILLAQVIQRKDLANDINAICEQYHREQTRADRGYWHIQESIHSLAIEKELLFCNTRPRVFENLFKSRHFVLIPDPKP